MQASNRDPLLLISLLLGFSAVALGAFGAHLFKETLEATGRINNWETAAHYHLIHVVAILCFVQLGARKAAWITVFGLLIFSGSLYILAYFDLPKLGRITPIGGALLLCGWGMTAFYAGKAPS